MLTPEHSVGAVGVAARVTFAGVGLRAGDAAKWLPAGSTGCDAAGATADASINADGSATFVLAAAGLHYLCFRFSDVAHPPWLAFRSIEFSAVSIESISPRGTAIGCQSVVSVRGQGLGAPAGATIECIWGALGGAKGIALPAVLWGDSVISCSSPSPDRVGSAELQLRFASSLSGDIWGDIDVIGDFVAFDPDSIELTTGSGSEVGMVLPAGAPYNIALDVAVSGHGLIDVGGAACSFGGHVGGPALASSDGRSAVCNKP